VLNYSQKRSIHFSAFSCSKHLAQCGNYANLYKVGNETGKQLFKKKNKMKTAKVAAFWGKQLIGNLPKVATEMYQSAHIHMQIG